MLLPPDPGGTPEVVLDEFEAVRAKRAWGVYGARATRPPDRGGLRLARRWRAAARGRAGAARAGGIPSGLLQRA